MNLDPKLWADLVGKPYIAGARGPAAYDCVGLTLEILRRRGFTVPDMASTAEELARQHRADEGILGPCREVDLPVGGAVVLLRSYGYGPGRHLGTMVDPFWMVHAWECSRTVVLVNLNRSYWGRRVLGFYVPEVTP